MQTAPKCPKCSRVYCAKDNIKHGGSYQGSASRIPLLLRCGHTFCTDCLNKVAKVQKKSVQCMIRTCQLPTILDVECSVKGLPTNIYIIGVLETYNAANPPPVFMKLTEFMRPPHLQSKRQKNKEDLCEECSTVQASCRCMKCQCNMCGVCFSRIHASSNILRQHQATPLERNQIEISKNDSEFAFPSTCQVHAGRNVEYFCEDDKVAICSYCVVMGDHKNHTISTCDDKNKQCFEGLTTLMAEAMTAVKFTKKSHQLLHSMIPSARTKSRALIDEIHLHFQNLHSLLQSREQTLCEDVLAISQQQISPVEDLATLSEHMKNLEAAIIDGRLIVTNNRYAAAQRCSHRLKQLVDIPCYADPIEQFEQLRYDMNEDLPLRDIQKYGEVTGFAIAPVELKSLSLAPDVDKEVAESSSTVASLCSALPCIASLSLSEPSLVISKSMLISSFSKHGDGDLDTCSVISNSSSSVASSKSLDVPQRPQLLATTSKYKKLKTEIAFVTHIQNPCQFIVQLNRDRDRLKKLNQHINDYCNLVTNANEVVQSFEPGDLALARFSKDNLWYRVRVLKQIDTEPVTGNPAKPMYEVSFIDYGNKEVIVSSRIRSVVSRFTRDPQLSMQCSLVDIVPAGSSRSGLALWTRDAIQVFANLAGNKPLTLTIIQERDSITYVDLSRPPSLDVEDDGPISVRDALVFLGVANFASPHSLPVLRPSRRRYLSPELPRPGELCEVSICHVESPSDFFVQLIGDESRYLMELMANLQIAYKGEQGDPYTVYCPSKGMMCVAQYSADKLWYRGEIIDIMSSGRIVVRYVDYGNTEINSIWNLRKLLDIYTVLPAQALHCSLADLVCLGMAWPSEAVQVMSSAMNKATELVMKVNEILSDRTLSVFIQDPKEKHSINATMVAQGWARATGVGWEMVRNHPSEHSRSAVKNYINSQKALPKVVSTIFSTADSVGLLGVKKEDRQKDRAVGLGKPFYPEVCVAHFVTPFEFYIHELQRKESLEKLVSDLSIAMKDNDTLNTKTVWTEGMECVALSQCEKKWARAIVSELAGENVKVILLDYGIEEELSASQLMVIPDSFCSQSGYALCCHLAEIMPAGDINKWSQTACEMLSSLLANQRKCYVVPKGVDGNGSLPVDLLIEEVIPGNALSSNTVKYTSIVQILREKGLALPKRNSGVHNLPERIITKHTADRRIPLCTLSFLSSGKSKDPAAPIAISSPILRPPSGVQSIHNAFQHQILPEQGSEVMLVVSYVDQHGHIFAHQLKEDLSELKELMREVQVRYADTEPDPGHRWLEGQPAVAQFSDDNMFYRVQVLNVRDNGFLEVFYVDFGNSEIVDPLRLRHGSVLTNVPMQAFHCKLHKVNWLSDDGLCPANVLEYIRQLLENQPCSAIIKGHLGALDGNVGSILEVDLFLPCGREVGTQLCEEGLARKESDDSEFATDDFTGADNFCSSTCGSNLDQTLVGSSLIDMTRCTAPSLLPATSCPKLISKRMVPSPFKQMPLPAVGDSLLVVITEVESPNVVYIQNVKHDDQEDPSWNEESVRMLDKLIELSEMYSEECDKLESLKSEEIKPGIPCVAQCTIDECWYRAEVMEVRKLDDEDGVEVCVLFVDYGSCDIITSKSRLRTIPPSHMDLPAQALACCIAEIASANLECVWTLAECEEFTKLFASKYVRAVVKDVSDDLVKVELYEDSVFRLHGTSAPLLYQALIDSGRMKSSNESNSDDEKAISIKVENDISDEPRPHRWSSLVDLVAVAEDE